MAQQINNSNASSTIASTIKKGYIDSPTKFKICETLLERQYTSDFAALFGTFEKRCFELTTLQIQREYDSLFKMSFMDILKIHSTLVEAPKSTREHVRSSLMPGLGDAVANLAINLAIRLCCMVDVHDSEEIPSVYRCLEWKDGLTIESFLAEVFPLNKNVENISLPPSFYARKLESVGGFKILWTDNLENHLVLDEANLTIKVFHHVSFLKATADLANASSDGKNHHPLLPQDLATETLETLALLFPRRSRKARRYLHRQKRMNPHIDSRIIDIETLAPYKPNLQNYQYWGSRLKTIQRAFDESKPSGFKQLVRDRRNGNEFYVFMMTIIAVVLALLFGLISSVTGIMQVWLAFKSSR